MQYGNVHNGGARVKPASTKTWDWNPKRRDQSNRANVRRDRYSSAKVEFAPELVQVAKALQIHPLELQKRLAFERKVANLLSKYER